MRKFVTNNVTENVFNVVWGTVEYKINDSAKKIINLNVTLNTWDNVGWNVLINITIPRRILGTLKSTELCDRWSKKQLEDAYSIVSDL